MAKWYFEFHDIQHDPGDFDFKTGCGQKISSLEDRISDFAMGF
ncbi:MAG: hypothetical protein NTX25_05030 [Proteobacteria bacterium]|nr:hypothetical protein [Pseudomonadota bacterium]